jgi:pimeloyl-ACP methyl ester carboxylesterase
MKKLLLLILPVCFLLVNAQAQNDMDKIMQEYQKLLSDPALKYGKDKAAGKYYNIRGFKMYVETYGTGQPLLFIHGNGGSISSFIKQIPYFSKKYKVIIADSRAQGKSYDLKNDSLTYEMMADDYATLLDSMKIDSAYVVGWSDGGINGLLLSMRHPEKVKKLAITGANLRADSTAVFQEVWDLVRPSFNEMKAKTNRNLMENAGFKLLRLLCEQPNIPATDLSQILCPTLVIGGDHDVIKESHTLEIYQHIPNAYLWILPASGHSTPVVYADEFNVKVDEFFKSTFRKIRGEGRFF